jgi:pimeloyl-ACP methyl ester carboxylesterase
MEATRGEVTVAAEGRRTKLRYYEAGEEGDEPPVVLLHGAGIDAAGVSFRYALPALAEQRRVLAPDLPGHGASGKPDASYTTDYFMEALEGFLDALDLDRVSLAGVSLGGALALGRALEAPDRVERLVLVSSYGLGGDAAWRPGASVGLRLPGFDRAFWTGMTGNPALLRAALTGLVGGRVPEDLLADVGRLVRDPAVGRTLTRWQRSEFLPTGLRTDHRDRLSALETPTLLVHGGRDGLLPASWSRTAARRLPNGEAAVFEDCGHWVAREAPEAFNGRLRSFLATATR